MKEYLFLINNKESDINEVWVHMKDPELSYSDTYFLKIPISNVPELFDPYGTKEEEKDWPDFVVDNVEELGTFILEGYFKAVGKMEDKERKGYKWVVTTLQVVRECFQL